MPPTLLFSTRAVLLLLHIVWDEGDEEATGTGLTFTIMAAPAVAATASVTVNV